MTSWHSRCLTAAAGRIRGSHEFPTGNSSPLGRGMQTSDVERTAKPSSMSSNQCVFNLRARRPLGDHVPETGWVICAKHRISERAVFCLQSRILDRKMKDRQIAHLPVGPMLRICDFPVFNLPVASPSRFVLPYSVILDRRGRGARRRRLKNGIQRSADEVQLRTAVVCDLDVEAGFGSDRLQVCTEN